MLRSGESLFRDTIWLSYDFQPKILFARETEQQRFATVIKPLFAGHSGRNLFVCGPPGVGKTTACKHVLRELEETTDEITSIYINCWKENTTFKIYTKICEDMGHKFLVAKKTSELFNIFSKELNKKSVVFIFDEIDKLEDTDFLYTILEDIYRKSIILITNYRDTYTELDERIRSRLNCEFQNFREYNEAEIKAILTQRRDYAFIENCWEEEAFKEIVEKCTEFHDVRIGLYLMKEAGQMAEDKSSRKITLVHAAQAIKKADEFHIKPKEGLDEELQTILQTVRAQNGKKIGEVYSAYIELPNRQEMSYKSFQRRITKLSEARFVTLEKVVNKEGNTSLVHFSGNKTLGDY